MSDGYYDCIDCGSENCPCELAETGDCIVCSRLAGKEKCECKWQGVCVYNEFVHAGKRASARREEIEAEIKGRKTYSENIEVLIIAVGRGFAEKAAAAGTYVFIKAPGDADFYNIPISILKSDIDKGEIHVAVKAIGAKSKKILNCGNKISVKGVYRNGVIGVRTLFKHSSIEKKPERLAVITKGIGFAPAVNILTRISGWTEADIFVDIDKLDINMTYDYIPEQFKENIRYVSLREEFSYRGVRDDESLTGCLKTKEYDKVVVLTSDYYIKEIEKLVPIDAASNNFHICCGEGICGACGYTDKDGRCFKMCKCAEMLDEML